MNTKEKEEEKVESHKEGENGEKSVELYRGVKRNYKKRGEKVKRGKKYLV
jgi:hypothetical protein